MCLYASDELMHAFVSRVASLRFHQESQVFCVAIDENEQYEHYSKSYHYFDTVIRAQHLQQPVESVDNL